MNHRLTSFAVIAAMLLMTLIAGKEVIARLTDPPPQTSPAIVTEPVPNTVVVTPVPAPLTTSTSTTSTSIVTTTTAHDALQADLDQLALDESVPCREWAPLALEVGWPPEELENLLEEIWSESRCQASIINKTSPDHGLLQLNLVWRDEFERYFGPWELVLDPRLNLAMGLEIWRWHDYHRGCGWEPWSRPC
jgi:hypothetical protein